MEIEKIIEKMRSRIESEEFRNKYRMSHLCFSHECELTFESVMLFVLCNNRSTLGVEVLNYCAATNMKHHASAFSRARQKIHYEAFADILRTMGEQIPKENLYKGYQLTAFDGTEFQLPKTEKLSEYRQPKDGYPVAHLISEYDVLNNIILDGEVMPYPADERAAAKILLERNSSKLNQIFLLDRGFPSVGLIKELNDKGLKFVFRVSRSFLKEVNAFARSDKEDETILIDYTKQRIRAGKAKIKEPYSFALRCVKIVLPSGETEILITNFISEFTIADLYELYGLRWGIETSYNHLKNSVMFERFFSLHENSVIQEVYTALIQQNLSTIAKESADELYKKNSRQEYEAYLYGEQK